MKRSQINRLIDQTMAWLEQRQVALPPFARWTPEEWAEKDHSYDEIRANMLGWDVTDYGRGDFDRVGLLLFTIRNGNLQDSRYAKPYAEKLLVSREGQLSPNHFHWHKMEDIINRGGGDLMVQVWNATAEEELGKDDVTVRLDGHLTTVPAGAGAAPGGEHHHPAPPVSRLLGPGRQRAGLGGIHGQRRQHGQPILRAPGPLHRHRGGRACPAPAVQ